MSTSELSFFFTSIECGASEGILDFKPSTINGGLSSTNLFTEGNEMIRAQAHTDMADSYVFEVRLKACSCASTIVFYLTKFYNHDASESFTRRMQILMNPLDSRGKGLATRTRTNSL